MLSRQYRNGLMALAPNPNPKDKERAVVKEHGGSVVSEILDHVDDVHGQPAYAESDRDGKDDLRHLPPLSESQQAHLLRLRPPVDDSSTGAGRS